jgi:hypothetical protein
VSIGFATVWVERTSRVEIVKKSVTVLDQCPGTLGHVLRTSRTANTFAGLLRCERARSTPECQSEVLSQSVREKPRATGFVRRSPEPSKKLSTETANFARETIAAPS